DDPTTLLEMIQARDDQMNRRSAAALRESSHAQRMGDLKQGLEKQKEAARDSLISGIFQASLAIASAVAQGVSLNQEVSQTVKEAQASKSLAEQQIKSLKEGESITAATKDAKIAEGTAKSAMATAQEAAAKARLIVKGVEIGAKTLETVYSKI